MHATALVSTLCKTTNKYIMTLYPSVWPLPYGVSIREDLSPDHNYAIPRSQTQCWAVKLGDWQQVQIAAVHNGFIGNQPWTIRAWLSADPNGSNILPVALGARRAVNLSGIGNKWCFYAYRLDTALLQEADINFNIDPNHIYYFNLQNLENKDNAYYLRFTYKSHDVTLEQ
jgi:hypothetical protein